MKILCVLGQYNYGNPARGEGYQHANFLPALRRLGHDVVLFDPFYRAAYRDAADLNRQFLETVQAEKPDIIFCVLLGYEIWLETLYLVRQCSDAILINWATDDSWRYEQFSRFISPPFHIYVTTYPEALTKAGEDGYANFVLSQWAANAETLAEPLPALDCRYPVSFVGSVFGNRQQQIAELEARGIHVECFGHGWDNGAVSSEQMRRIIRESVISLNFGDSGLVMQGAALGRSRQVKARNFEVPGVGGFVISERSEYLNSFYVPDQEVVMYDGMDELTDKIKFFLAHPDQRDAIAQAGHKRTREEHTYDVRFRHLLELASQHGAGMSGSPVRCEIDFERYAVLEHKHRAGFALKLLRWVLLLPCVAIWGRKRGPRAARRVLFEISWRVGGEKTYSVTGWPGRIFFRES